MLCVTLLDYQRPCGPVTGGISNILFFDPSDINFTQVSETSPYSAISLRDGATAPVLFAIKFNDNEADRAWTHTRNGCSVKYEHTVSASLPQLSNALTNFLQGLDSAGCCCGLGVIIRHRDGKRFVMGEKYVNGTEAPEFKVQMTGSDGSTGRLYDDPNGANIKIVGTFSRDLREISAGWDAIQALSASGEAATYDEEITFTDDATPDPVGGVTVAAGSTNDNLKFEFDPISPASGTPTVMNVKVNNTTQLVVSFPNPPYVGESFRFTDTTGIVHTGTFASGDVNF